MQDTVAGKNVVLNMLEAGKSINQILISSSSKRDPKISDIVHLAHINNVKFTYVTKRKLDEIAKENIHQGVIAYIPPRQYYEIEDLIEEAELREEDPFILILDSIEDPHNLGAIIRSAVAAGVHGVVIPERRSVQVNQTVAKVAAGAVDYCKIARVTNLTTTINWLKKKGVWVFGAAMEGETSYLDAKFNGPVALVLGNEGKGISKLVAQSCDYLINIPMYGPVESLNVSVSAALLVFKVREMREHG